jgi:hypothetical protein
VLQEVFGIFRPSGKLQLRPRVRFEQKHAPRRERSPDLAKQRALQILNTQNKSVGSNRQNHSFKIGLYKRDPLVTRREGVRVPQSIRLKAKGASPLLQNIQTGRRTIHCSHWLLPRSKQECVPPGSTRQIEGRPARQQRKQLKDEACRLDYGTLSRGKVACVPAGWPHG